MSRNTAYIVTRAGLILYLAASASLMAQSTNEHAVSQVVESSSGESSFGEYEVKAGFVYRFLSFVTWPETNSKSETVTIGVLGKNHFGLAFKSVEGTVVGNRKVNVRYFRSEVDYDDLKQCQVLFISDSEEKKLQDILRAIDRSAVLTIGDSKGFVDNGGMIGFVRKDNARIGVELNVAAAGKAGITIRAMLQRIAVRIIDEPVRNKEDGSDTSKVKPGKP